MKLIYTYRNGSVPPPHHFEVAIRIEPGKPGVYEFRPGYPGMGAGIPVWKENFAFTDRQHGILFQKLVALGLTKRWAELKPAPVGGGSATLTVIEGGKTYKIPAFPADRAAAQQLYETVEGIVPPALIKKQKARFEALAKDKKPGIQ